MYTQIERWQFKWLLEGKKMHGRMQKKRDWSEKQEKVVDDSVYQCGFLNGKTSKKLFAEQFFCMLEHFVPIIRIYGLNHIKGFFSVKTYHIVLISIEPRQSVTSTDNFNLKLCSKTSKLFSTISDHHTTFFLKTNTILHLA